MSNAETLLKAFFVLLIGAGLTVGAAAIQMEGTSSFNPFTGSDGEPRYTLSTSIGVEGTGTAIKINEGSYGQTIQQTSLLGGLSFAGQLSALSLTEAENVELKYTLHGPIDQPVVKTDNLGNVGKLGGSKTSSFKARNLPCGSYVLHMNLNWNTGSDYYQRDIQINCREDGGGSQ